MTSARPPSLRLGQTGGAEVTTIVVNGVAVPALRGQSLAGALEAAGIRAWRRNPVNGKPRAPFCGMGVCFECELHVKGTTERRACMIEIEPDLAVSTEASEKNQDIHG